MYNLTMIQNWQSNPQWWGLLTPTISFRPLMTTVCCKQSENNVFLKLHWVQWILYCCLLPTVSNCIMWMRYKFLIYFAQRMQLHRFSCVSSQSWFLYILSGAAVVTCCPNNVLSACLEARIRGNFAGIKSRFIHDVSSQKKYMAIIQTCK